MKETIKKYRGISYVITAILATLLLTALAFRCFDTTYVVKGNEETAGVTAPVMQGGQIRQVFIAEDTWIDAIKIAALVDDGYGKVFHFRVYDEIDQILMDRDIVLEEYSAPGFFTVPLDFETVPGRAYVWQIDAREEVEVPLVYQTTQGSGFKIMGDYYYNGEQIQGKSIIARYQYTDKFGWKKTAAAWIGLSFISALIIFLFEQLGKRGYFAGRVTLGKLLSWYANPLLVGIFIYLNLAVWIFSWFGGTVADKLLYEAGICIGLGWLFALVNAKRAGKRKKFLLETHVSYEKIMDILQSVMFAGILTGCVNYMNGLYEIYHTYAYREVLIFTGLFLLTMCDREAILNKISLIWCVPAGVAGIVYYMLHKEEELTGKVAGYDAWLFVIAGLLLLQLFFILKDKKINLKNINPLYGGLLGAFFAFLLIFKNQRGWPIYMVCVFVLFYLFYFAWQGKDRFLKNVCNGIIFQFACSLIYCMLHRPFRAWVFNRYNFTFHTVTITATYLTLIIGALLIKLLAKYRKSSRFGTWGATGMLYGLAMAYLFLTLSRTGYLAAIAMVLVLVPFIALVCYKDNILMFLKKAALVILIPVLMIPTAYSAVRLIPALYDDPYIFEVEESGWAVHKGESMDSENYMSFSWFRYVITEKLLGSDTALKEEAQEFMLAFTGQVKEMDQVTLVASEEEYAPGSLEEFSNGRFDIFRAYIDNWNATGHVDMGVTLPNGEISVHAHNTYLQVIHDFGLIAGLVFLAAGIVSVILMFRYAVLNIDKDAYGALPLAVMIGFAVAGLVEWLFHPCHPLGYTTLAVMAPLLYQNKLESKENRNVEKRTRKETV